MHKKKPAASNHKSCFEIKNSIKRLKANIYQTIFPFYPIKIISPFLNSIISANNEKGNGFQPMQCWNPYTPYLFSSVESLNSIHSHWSQIKKFL